MQLTAYYQPRRDRPSDYRASAAAELRIPLTKQWSLKIIDNLSYDKTPATTIKSLDNEAKLAITVGFGG